MISERVHTVRERIALACVRAGRDPAEVTLVAVGKAFPSERVQEAIRAGIADVGENYVQELLRKRGDLAAEQVRWHFIGHLQTNKVRSVTAWIHCIHSVDSVALAREIDKHAAHAERVVDVLLEVNTTGEASKFGISPDGAIGLLKQLEGLEHLRIAGFMTIGPFLPDPEGSRPMFRRLRALREEAAAVRQPNAPVRHLSMGMTGDFEVAVDEGATMVRIGTAIFGARTKTV
jgi:pyridoxal phosphate enzyme (YggS family)